MPYFPPYNQNFETYLPGCWEEATAGDPTTGPTDNVNGLWIADGFLNVGTTGAVKINLYITGREEWLITPDIDLSGTGGPFQLRYVAGLTDFGNSNPPEGNGMGSDDEVQVLISEDDGVTWTNLKTYNQADHPSETGDVEHIDLSGYTGGIVKIAFWATDGAINDDEDYDFFIDDVKVREIPSCYEPISLVSNDHTATSANISWDPENDETEWTVVYGTPGFDPDTAANSIMDNDGTLGVTIDGLEPITTYEVYVKAICGVDDESAWTGPLSFTTLCGSYPPPYNQNFDTYLPECWEEADAGNPTSGPTMIGSGNWTTTNYLNNPANGPATKIILFGNTISDWLLSPEIDLSSQAELTYKVGFTTLNGTAPPTALGVDDQVQVLITADGGTTWENLKTYNTSNIPTDLTETIDLSAYTGTVQFAFWATDGPVSDTPESFDVFFDSFAVNEIICPAVTEFSESFDASSDMPACWSTLKVDAPAIAVVQVQTNPANSFSPPNSIRMFNQLGGTADLYLISPKVSNLDDATHQLRFAYRGQPNTSGMDAIIEVGTMTDPTDASTFTLVETLTSTSDVFQEYTIAFDQASTDEFLAIKADFQVIFRNIHFDDINWEPIPTCPKPSSPVATNLTSTSADLSWTTNGTESEWEIIYGLAGFDPLTQGTTITDTDALGETVQGLEIGTDYEFYVRAICGAGDESQLSFPGAFTTLCDIYPLDYAQGFSTFVPNCWEEADAGNPTSGPTMIGSGNWTTTNYLNNPANGPATKIILFGNTISDWLLSPEIDLSSQAELTYKVGFTTLNGTAPPTALGVDDQVQVLITADGGTTWENLKTYNTSNIPTDLTETIDLSAYTGTVQFAFWATDGPVSDTPESFDVFFDSFAVNALIVPCVDPSGINVTNISTNGATITWTENGSAESWDVIYGLSGFDPQTSGMSETVNTTPELIVTGLDPDKTYDVYVRAICGPSDTSELAGPVTFTTNPLGVNDVTIEGFIFHPNPVNNQIKMRASSVIDNVTIYNLVGQVIYKSHIGKNEAQIEVSNLQVGVYLMQITSSNITQTVKFVKE